MAPTATNTKAAYATAPLGNNKALTTIELSGLINNNETTAANNQFTKIGDNT